MKPTRFNTFAGKFCAKVVTLLGGPEATVKFFSNHQDLQHSQLSVAQQAFQEGIWGYTPQAAAREWYRQVLGPLLTEKV